eukprot:gene1967-biopygen3470
MAAASWMIRPWPLGHLLQFSSCTWPPALAAVRTAVQGHRWWGWGCVLVPWNDSSAGKNLTLSECDVTHSTPWAMTAAGNGGSRWPATAAVDCLAANSTISSSLFLQHQASHHNSIRTFSSSDNYWQSRQDTAAAGASGSAKGSKQQHPARQASNSSSSSSSRWQQVEAAQPGRHAFGQPHDQHHHHCQVTHTGTKAVGYKAPDPAQLTVFIKQTKSPQQLQELVRDHQANMNFIHLSAAFSHLAKMQVAAADRPAVRQLLGQLEHLLLPQLDQCGLRALSNTAWSCSTLQHTDTALFSSCMARFMQQVDHVDQPQAISIVLWAAANSSYVLNEQQVHQLVAVLTRPGVLQEAKPQAVSNTLWAVATMGQRLEPPKLQQLLSAVLGQLQQIKPQEVSNILWAVAIIGGQFEQLQLQQLLSALLHRLEQAMPQAVSNTLLAVAKMGQQLEQQQLQRLLSAFLQQRHHIQPQAVSNTLWAVTTIGGQVKQQQLQQMLKILTDHLLRTNSEDVSSTLWACAKIRYLPVELLSAMNHKQQWARLLPCAVPQELANTAWALGQLGQVDEQLHGALLRRAVQLVLQADGVNAFSSQGLCNLCWSVAVLDLQQLIPQLQVLVQACSHQPLWNSMAIEGLRQLYQVHLWLVDCQLAGCQQGLLGTLTAEQLQQCEAACKKQLRSTTAAAQSPFQRDVFKTLQQMPSSFWQQAPQLEQLCQPDGALSIDITATTAAGVQLAVEADGPSHFRWPDSDRGLMGPTLFRNRALSARGYTVVCLPYYEWDKLGTEAAAAAAALVDRYVWEAQQQYGSTAAVSSVARQMWMTCALATPGGYA